MKKNKRKRRLSAKVIRLLRRVKQRILDEPNQFHMNHFFTNDPQLVGVREIPNCGTAACIAGWVLSLSKKKGTPKKELIDIYPSAAGEPMSVASRCVSDDASEIIGFYADNLFYIDKWPSKFFRRGTGYDMWAEFSALSKLKQARLAARRIEHFIKTDGME